MQGFRRQEGAFEKKTLGRREALGSLAGLGLGAGVGWTQDASRRARRLPALAAINSVYRYKSHAYHIVGRFIHGYDREGFHYQPPFRVLRMYNHQRPANDMSGEICSRHAIEPCRSISEALGGRRLDVDGVLLIVEHGDYPVNNLGQIQYPRYELFEQIVEVFRRSERSVPVFVDKALSYDARLAARMVRTARELRFGLMAGSSLPVTWRRPELDPPLGTPFSEGVVVFGYDRGTPEIYLFHALEALQCLLERRPGGETGVREVTGLQGRAVWEMLRNSRWTQNLVDTALAHNPSTNVGTMQENCPNPLAIVVDYRDGTRGVVLDLPEHCSDISFAGKIRGKDDPVATCFMLPSPPGAKFFDPLVANIEKLFLTGVAPYPVERTLLTSTLLDWALRSIKAGGQPMTDATLQVAYSAPADSGFFRGRYTDR